MPMISTMFSNAEWAQSMNVAKLKFIASNDDYYSPTDWDQQPDESDADYEERSEDLESYYEYGL